MKVVQLAMTFVVLNSIIVSRCAELTLIGVSNQQNEASEWLACRLI